MTPLALKKMSRREKLATMETLWADLSQDEAAYVAPAWHEAALLESAARVKAGRSKFGDWAEAKARIARKVATLA